MDEKKAIVINKANYLIKLQKAVPLSLIEEAEAVCVTKETLVGWRHHNWRLRHREELIDCVDQRMEREWRNVGVC